MKRMKQIVAGLLVAVMFVAGLVITPLDAVATEMTMDTVEEGNGVIYQLNQEAYNFMDYWKEDVTERKAPTMYGKVFGGWYKKVEGSMKPITEEAAKDIQDGAGIYAKFVPAEVLSIRAQLEIDTETQSGANVETVVDGEGKETTYLRLLSGVNGLDYQKVGFDILYNKKTPDSLENIATATNITKVFSKITNDETGKDGMVASELFGGAATHFSVLRLDGIYAKNFTKVIYVTPQWTTLDGTLVEGQAKYVRVMDGYATTRYISVPINLLEGDAVAAGQMELQYDQSTLQFVGFEPGVMMPEMDYNAAMAGIVKIVGSVKVPETADQTLVDVSATDDIYANVWFQVKTDLEESQLPDFYTFMVDGVKFCNWAEAEKDVTAWDVTYWR